MCLLSVWRPHILLLDHQVLIKSMIQFHLKWWMDTNGFVQGTFIHPPDPNPFLFTDASHYGWGAHLEPMRLSFHGRWTEIPIPDPYQYSGNNSHSFCTEESHTIHTQLWFYVSNDNTTVDSYINKQGGTHSPQPMHGGMGNSPLVPWNTILYSEFVISQANSIS